MGTIERVAVVGAGTMGRQISLQIARSGFDVTLYDSDPAALDRAHEAQLGFAAAWARQGLIGEDEATAAVARVRLVADLGSAVRDVDLAIEAVPERLELKRELFATLDEYCPEHAIVATNSSSIRVSLVEDATGRPERVANYHFLMPVWDHPLVEIGGGTASSSQTLDDLAEFARRIGVLPLRVGKESTGFVFNRVWRAVKKEALKVVDSGVSTPEDVDRAWLVMFGAHSNPPFALMDQIGLDIVMQIEEHYARESGDPADLPPPVLTEKVARGELGQKTGAGFYRYPNPSYLAPEFLDPLPSPFQPQP